MREEDTIALMKAYLHIMDNNDSFLSIVTICAYRKVLLMLLLL